MSSQEYWTIDSIHDGNENRDLLIYCKDPEIPTEGIYVKFSKSWNTPNTVGGTTFSSGKYRYALPTIGDAEFKTKEHRKFGSMMYAIDYARKDLGLTFLSNLKY